MEWELVSRRPRCAWQPEQWGRNSRPRWYIWFTRMAVLRSFWYELLGATKNSRLCQTTKVGQSSWADSDPIGHTWTSQRRTRSASEAKRVRTHSSWGCSNIYYKLISSVAEKDYQRHWTKFRTEWKYQSRRHFQNYRWLRYVCIKTWGDQSVGHKWRGKWNQTRKGKTKVRVNNNQNIQTGS